MLTLYGIHSVTADCDVCLSHVGGGVGGGRVSWDKICAQRYPVKQAFMNQSNPKRSHQTTQMALAQRNLSGVYFLEESRSSWVLDLHRERSIASSKSLT